MPDLLQRWVSSVSGPGWKWYVKVLSGNDTLLNASHQAGPYVPKPVVFDLFPSIGASGNLNPRRAFHVVIDSHASETDATAIWYNNRAVAAGTRDEARFTNWGGRESPILDPEATGSLCVFAFRQRYGSDSEECRVWLCSSVEEEEYITDLLGPVEPGTGLYFESGSLRIELVPTADRPCSMRPDEIPAEWRLAFPDASAVVAKSVSNLPSVRRLTPDERILKRRECEFEIFRSLEEAIVLPRIKEGFATVDIFVAYANSVTNRRKSRSGASLELQSRTVFEEERLPHSYGEVSEGRKRPDFLFPSVEAYRDRRFDARRLRMLGVKTTCKDRWRQILNEADRIPQKHLLTIQEGVSVNQFEEMTAAGVTLVVPRGLHRAYVDSVRAHLLSLKDFITTTKAAYDRKYLRRLIGRPRLPSDDSAG